MKRIVEDFELDIFKISVISGWKNDWKSNDGIRLSPYNTLQLDMRYYIIPSDALLEGL